MTASTKRRNSLDAKLDVRVPVAIRDRIDRHARAKGMLRSDVVRQALAWYCRYLDGEAELTNE